MRASREAELAKEYPIHVVRTWLGNTPRTAMKHYLQVTDTDFERASRGGAESGTRQYGDKAGLSGKRQNEQQSSLVGHFEQFLFQTIVILGVAIEICAKLRIRFCVQFGEKL